MNDLLRSAFIAVALVLSVAAPGAAKSTAPAKVAPADEYFGPLKMSILGIRNTLKDDFVKLESSASVDTGDAFRHAAFVEKSIRAWEHKYPADSWLPRAVLALHRVYARIASSDAERSAAETATWLIQRYPNSREAAQLRSESART
jgi:hypothetical protein